MNETEINKITEEIDIFLISEDTQLGDIIFPVQISSENVCVVGLQPPLLYPEEFMILRLKESCGHEDCLVSQSEKIVGILCGYVERQTVSGTILTKKGMRIFIAKSFIHYQEWHRNKSKHQISDLPDNERNQINKAIVKDLLKRSWNTMEEAISLAQDSDLDFDEIVDEIAPDDEAFCEECGRMNPDSPCVCEDENDFQS